MLVCDKSSLTHFRTNCATACKNLQTDIYQSQAGKQLRQHLILDPLTYRIFQEVQELARYRHGCCFASLAEIAAKANVSRKTVQRHLPKLEKTLVDGKTLLRKHIRSRKDGGRDSNAYEVLNIKTMQYNPATWWILDRDAKERAKRMPSFPSDFGHKTVPPPWTESPTNKGQVTSLLISNHERKEKKEAEVTVESVTNIDTSPVRYPIAKATTHEVAMTLPKKPLSNQDAIAGVLSPFKYSDYFLPGLPDLVCYDETLIFQFLGLSQSEVQTLVGVARKNKLSQDDIYNAIQCLFDNSQPVHGRRAYLYHALRERHKPNVPRIQGLPPIHKNLSFFELRNLQDLNGHFFDGYGIFRHTYQGREGWALMSGDRFHFEFCHHFADKGSTSRRSLLMVLAGLYKRIVDISIRNGNCRDEYGNKKSFKTPCSMVRKIMELKEKQDMREILANCEDHEVPIEDSRCMELLRD